MSEGEIVKVENVSLGSLQVDPKSVVSRATEIAKELGDVIEKRKLYATIQGKKFVTVEGWSTLGALLGVLPREVETKRLEDGGYESTVELIRASDQAVIGKASAIVSMDEVWGKRLEYARRSMAQTRATGKAYRLGFSWIVKLAGYEPTPAEEMPVDAEFKDEPIKEPNKESWQLLTREQAEDTLSHDGVRYGDIAQSELEKRFIGISKKLRLSDLPEDERTELQGKYDAITALRVFRGKEKK